MARIGASGGGGSSVQTILPVNDSEISVFVGSDGKYITSHGNAVVKTGGYVQAQGFIFNRQITTDVTVPDHYSIIASNIELNGGSITLAGDSTLVLV